MKSFVFCFVIVLLWNGLSSERCTCPLHDVKIDGNVIFSEKSGPPETWEACAKACQYLEPGPCNYWRWQYLEDEGRDLCEMMDTIYGFDDEPGHLSGKSNCR